MIICHKRILTKKIPAKAFTPPIGLYCSGEVKSPSLARQRAMPLYGAKILRYIDSTIKLLLITVIDKKPQDYCFVRMLKYLKTILKRL